MESLYTHSNGDKSDFPTHLDPLTPREKAILADDDRRAEEELKRKETKRLENIVNIANEKNLAKGVVAKLLVIGQVYVAGGAPRDWELNTTCNDIDIFYESTIEYPHELKAQLEHALRIDIAHCSSAEQMKMLGWHHEDDIEDLNILPVYALGDVRDISADEQYDNSNVKAVFETEISMRLMDMGDDLTDEQREIITKKVQFICVKDTYDLFKFFDCSINCIKMELSQWKKYKQFWDTSYSTLHRAGKILNKIHFTEEVFDKGIKDNKAYQKFCKNGDYYVGTETEFITKLYNTLRHHIGLTDLDDRVGCDNIERRHENTEEDFPF